MKEGYGGIWLTGKPFVINTKCIIIGIMAAGIYALPRFTLKGNLFMMAFIFVITYILISLYDHMYNCDAHMFSMGISPTSIFKPQRRGTAREPPHGERVAVDQERMYMRTVSWTHAIIIAPIFLYGAWDAIRRNKKIYDNDNTPQQHRNYSVWPVAFGISMLALFYHVIRIFYPRNSCI